MKLGKTYISDKKMVELIVDRVINRVAEDLTRIGNISMVIPLIEISLIQNNNENPSFLPQASNIEGDLLRAMIVFGHASLEEVVRQIARLKIIDASAAVLKKIPLVDTRQGSKFTLDQLIAYRGQSIDDVLQASIDYYLDRFSIRTFGDIEIMLDSLEIDRLVIEPYKKYLSPLILRRHKIVHESDRDDNGDFRDIDLFYVLEKVVKIAEFTLELVINSYPKPIKELLIENGTYQKTKKSILSMSEELQNLLSSVWNDFFGRF